jgi:hypothetical protein
VLARQNRPPIEDHADLVDIIDDSIQHLALERLEHNSPVPGDELRLSVSRKHESLADVEDRNYGNDVSKLTRASAFDVRVELLLEKL